jgi:peptide/nickel transport system permease protein
MFGSAVQPRHRMKTLLKSILQSTRSLPLAGKIGLVAVVFWLFIALFGPYIAPHEVGAIVSPDVFSRLTAAHPLGTDYLGRDMLSRVLHGARYTVGLALVAALAASIAGTTLGLTAAVAGRGIDELMSRAMDALISIPSKMLALVMVAAYGSSAGLLILTAALSYTPGAYRIARSLAVNVRSLEYVQVAEARGERLPYLAWREILPNMINPMLADFGLRFVFVVLLLSGMSFLGLGVQPPNADLGSLVRENIAGLGEGAPAVLMPALAIATLTVGVNMLIDSLSGRGARVEN